MPLPHFSSAERLSSALAEAAAAVATAFEEASAVRGLSDSELEFAIGRSAELQQSAARMAALEAGEIAHRSRPELGFAGLAQRNGHRTPEAMVAVAFGVSEREAQVAVSVGRVVRDSAVRDSSASEDEAEQNTVGVKGPARARTRPAGPARATRSGAQ